LSVLRISFHKNAVKKIKRIPREYAKRILDFIKIIAKKPFNHGQELLEAQDRNL